MKLLFEPTDESNGPEREADSPEQVSRRQTVSGSGLHHVRLSVGQRSSFKRRHFDRTYEDTPPSSSTLIRKYQILSLHLVTLHVARCLFHTASVSAEF